MSAVEKLRSDIDFLTAMRDIYHVENMKVRINAMAYDSSAVVIAMNNRTIEQYNRSIEMLNAKLKDARHNETKSSP